MNIRSVSLDTSFLLHGKPSIGEAIKLLKRDNVPCFITSTVASEIEQLKVWGRISTTDYKRAMKRWKTLHAKVIDFKNRLLSDTFGNTCIRSMKKHHGVNSVDIANDCNILVSALKNGVDLFLSEDYHFTSEITKEVINDVKSSACQEYHLMCDSMLYSIDAKTFLEAYNHGQIDLDIVRSKMLRIRKSGKQFK